MNSLFRALKQKAVENEDEIIASSDAINTLEKAREALIEVEEGRAERASALLDGKIELHEPLPVVRDGDGKANGFATIMAGSKRRRTQVAPAAPAAPVYEPPIALRKPTRAGGSPKPSGVVFRALFVDARPLMRLFDNFSNLTDNLPFEFANDGLHVRAQDLAIVLMVSVHVPLAAFARYDNFVGGVQCVLSRSPLLKFGRGASNEHTVQFMRDHYEGNGGEPLCLQLHPRRKNALGTIAEWMTPIDVDCDMLEFRFPYHYAIHCAPEHFVASVRQLADRSKFMQLSICDEKVVFTAVGENEQAITLIELPAIQKKLRRKQKEDLLVAAAHDDELWKQVEDILAPEPRCTSVIERLPAADTGNIAMKDVNCYSIASGYLRKAFNFTTTTNCVGITIEMAVDDGEALPLRISLRHRTAQNQTYTTTIHLMPR